MLSRLINKANSSAVAQIRDNINDSYKNDFLQNTKIINAAVNQNDQDNQKIRTHCVVIMTLVSCFAFFSLVLLCFCVFWEHKYMQPEILIQLLTKSSEEEKIKFIKEHLQRNLYIIFIIFCTLSFATFITILALELYSFSYVKSGEEIPVNLSRITDSNTKNQTSFNNIYSMINQYV